MYRNGYNETESAVRPENISLTGVALFSFAVFVILLACSMVVWYVALDWYGPRVNTLDTLELLAIIKFLPDIILAVLLVFSILFSFILYFIIAGKRRAVYLANKQMRSLISSEQLFYTLYEDAPIPYMLLTADGKIMNPNKSALRLYGKKPEDLSGANLFFDFHPEEDMLRAKELEIYYGRYVPIKDEEMRVVRQDGSIRWVSVSVFPGTDLQRRLTRSKDRQGLVSMVDITERKEIDQAKSEFVSLTSHQLGTPIAAIKWYVETLLSGTAGELTEKQNEYAKKLYRIAENMADLVGTYLNVAKIEMGALMPKLAPTNVIDICVSVVEELESQLTQKGIELLADYDDIDEVKTDPRFMRLIIQNLLSNAVKYTPDNGRVTLNLSNESGNILGVSVSDTGIGIPAEEQGRIFSKLFRAGNAIAKETSGNGLGLYMIKSMVEAMGGSISFNSELNVGTTFNLRIPKK